MSETQITKDHISSSINFIESSISGKTIPSDQIKSSISALRSDLETIKHSLAPYELQSFSTKINDLSKNLETKNSSTTRKFKFSSIKSRISKREKKVELNFQETEIEPTISNKTDEVVLINDNDLNPIIQNVSKCIVIARRVNSLQMFNISDSMILIDHNTSSNFMKNVKNCTIILGKNSQTRLHNLEKCNIKLIGLDKIIIEDCTDLNISKGVHVDDFNSPLGNSTHFQYVEFSTQFDQLVENLKTHPVKILKDIENYLSLV